MTADETYQFLVESLSLSEISTAALMQLASMSEPRRWSANEVLFYEGSVCGDLFLVKSGRVQLQMRVPGRGSVPVLTLGAGQLVAWSAFLGTGEMTTSAVALEDTDALALPGDRLKALCELDYDFGYRFVERLASALSRRLIATRLQLLDLFAREAPQFAPMEEGRG